MTARSVDRFSTTIDRPPDVVFAYLSDVSRHGEWSPRPFRIEGSSGPVAAGDHFTSVGNVPGDKHHRNDVTVVECAARRLVLDSVDRGEHFVNTFEVQADGDGSRVTRTVDAPKPSFPLSVVFPLIMAAFIRPDVTKGLANLKAALERG